MFLSCFTVASNTTGDKTALLGKVPYFVCVSFLIVQHDIRGYLSIDASHNCSIIPLYWIMFCVILAALLSSVSTIKPLPSEDSGIASTILFCRRSTTSVGVNTLWERHLRYKKCALYWAPASWLLAHGYWYIHYDWTLWCILYSLSTSPTKQTQTAASSTPPSRIT